MDTEDGNNIQVSKGWHDLEGALELKYKKNLGRPQGCLREESRQSESCGRGESRIIFKRKKWFAAWKRDLVKGDLRF